MGLLWCAGCGNYRRWSWLCGYFRCLADLALHVVFSFVELLDRRAQAASQFGNAFSSEKQESEKENDDPAGTLKQITKESEE